MSKVIEAFRSAKKRINPEGLAISTTIAVSSLPVILPLEGITTYAMHEFSKDADPDVFKFLTIGILGLINAVSIATETKALQVDHYCASPTASGLNVATGRPFASSFLGHAINYAQLFVLNPINYAAVFEQNTQLLTESAVGTSVALTVWLTLMNALILQGKIQPVVDSMRKARQSAIVGIIKTKDSIAQKLGK